MNLSVIDSKLVSVIHSKKFSILMLTCLVGYVLLKNASRVSGDVFQTIFVIGTVFALYLERKHIFKDKMLICLFWTLILQILSWINATVQLPQLAQSAPNFGNLANLFFFIFIAYWLKGNIKFTYTLWFTMIIGFILSFYVHSPRFIQELIQGVNGERIYFGINNAQHPALWSGLAFLILSYFSIKSCYLSKIKKRGLYLFIAAILSLINLFFIFVIFATQTRQVFLGIIVACTLGPISYILLQKHKPSLMLVSSCLLGMGLLTLATLNVQGINNRVSLDENIFTSILSGDLNQIPYTSTGTRLHIWYEALDWITERPILGSDQDVRDDVIRLSERIPEKIKNEIVHLHNSFIEITLSYGLLGLLTIGFVFYWLLHSTLNISSKGEFNEIRLLSLIFLTYWFVVNNFESYLFSSTGLLVHNIMFGTLYTFYFTQQLENRKNEDTI
ncbi:O-antigen ligase family protein [Vibrio splendidus]|uniref:O-antigen ligase family protein n=1 Tax=Vibrio splendidus TaxID=29497 RepID=UPI00031631C7|nr:O-antigen ligase family protein [Vibrio splendidus]OEF74548.1 O-antigen polymerase [Vibrio splendidus 1F-157]PTP72921.1 O-antigen polymerase [Vibrio splendidus]